MTTFFWRCNGTKDTCYLCQKGGEVPKFTLKIWNESHLENLGPTQSSYLRSFDNPTLPWNPHGNSQSEPTEDWWRWAGHSQDSPRYILIINTEQLESWCHTVWKGKPKLFSACKLPKKGSDPKMLSSWSLFKRKNSPCPCCCYWCLRLFCSEVCGASEYLNHLHRENCPTCHPEPPSIWKNPIPNWTGHKVIFPAFFHKIINKLITMTYRQAIYGDYNQTQPRSCETGTFKIHVL